MKSPIKLLIGQLIVIPLVILIFKLPAEKKVLSLLANGVFWTIGLLTLCYQGRDRKWVNLFGLQFILVAVLPISILRVMSWQSDFNSESLLGLTGKQWHSNSNISFMIMLLGTFLLILFRKVKPLQH